MVLINTEIFINSVFTRFFSTRGNLMYKSWFRQYAHLPKWIRIYISVQVFWLYDSGSLMFETKRQHLQQKQRRLQQQQQHQQQSDQTTSDERPKRSRREKTRRTNDQSGESETSETDVDKQQQGGETSDKKNDWKPWVFEKKQNSSFVIFFHKW